MILMQDVKALLSNLIALDNEEEFTSALQITKKSVSRYLRESPILRPISENQDVGTPIEFLCAAQSLLGPIIFDVAASELNHVCDAYFTKEVNSFDSFWPETSDNEWLWLNPPYAELKDEPWLDRCIFWKNEGRNVMVLIPASVSSRWWKRNVDGEAYVINLTARMKFKGSKNTYPRDLALLLYSNSWNPNTAFNPHNPKLHPSVMPPKHKDPKPSYLGSWDWQALLQSKL